MQNGVPTTDDVIQDDVIPDAEVVSTEAAQPEVTIPQTEARSPRSFALIVMEIIQTYKASVSDGALADVQSLMIGMLANFFGVNHDAVAFMISDGQKPSFFFIATSDAGIAVPASLQGAPACNAIIASPSGVAYFKTAAVAKEIFLSQVRVGYRMPADHDLDALERLCSELKDSAS